jgi:hypothetical protein
LGQERSDPDARQTRKSFRNVRLKQTRKKLVLWTDRSAGDTIRVVLVDVSARVARSLRASSGDMNIIT